MKLPYERNQVVNEQLKRESLLFGIREGWGLCNNLRRSFFANIYNLMFIHFHLSHEQKALGSFICIRDLNHTVLATYCMIWMFYFFISYPNKILTPNLLKHRFFTPRSFMTPLPLGPPKQVATNHTPKTRHPQRILRVL